MRGKRTRLLPVLVDDTYGACARTFLHLVASYSGEKKKEDESRDDEKKTTRDERMGLIVQSAVNGGRRYPPYPDKKCHRWVRRFAPTRRLNGEQSKQSPREKEKRRGKRVGERRRRIRG